MMNQHRNQMPCALEIVPRPGDRETRVRIPAPAGEIRAQREGRP